jgi:Uma2 family endonuclease
VKPTSPSSSPQQEYPYGWRYVKRVTPDGTETLDQVALTLEDVLHPQEGDVIPESIYHDTDCSYLAAVFRSRLGRLAPVALVTHDLLLHWGVEGIRNHSPDVAVFVGLDREPEPTTGTLELPSLGGRCELVVEVVSPSTRKNDVIDKFDHYHRVGVPVYVIIDQEKEDGPRSVRAYRRKPDRYVEIESDDRYRIDLPILGLMLGLRDERACCWDLRTGEELGDYTLVTQERDEARQERDQAKLAREKLEEELGDEVEARHEAERLTADAHKEADRHREEADKQRQEADRAQKEADRQREEAGRAQKEADRQREEADRQREEADRQREEADRQRRAREEMENQKKLAEEQAAKTIRELQEQLRLLQAAGADPNPPAG